MAPKFESSTDPSKDTVEKSSQVDQIDNMLDEQLGLTDEEKALDPDREGLDVRSAKTADLLDHRREPDVKVVEEGKPVVKAEEETPLAKALKTVEEQGRRLQELEARITSDATRREGQAEPQIEMVEVLPNLRLPKDPKHWPIKLTDEDLIALGWNDEKRGPAQVLRVLGNALYLFAVETIPDLAGKALETRFTERDAATKTQQAFESMFPHLVKHRDIVGLVERNERQNPNSSLRGKYGNDYYQELGRLGEARVADIRGITVEQYRAEIVSQRRSSTQKDTTKSRAVSTGGGVRGERRQPQSDFERDSADL